MKQNLLILLTLTALLLSACSALSPAGDPLDGTAWQLSALGEKSPVAGSTVTLEFNDGQAGGTAGCNSYGGAYEVEGENIAFREIVSTLMACADQAVMDQEAMFLSALNEADRFELANGQLRLFRPSGEPLTFIPAP